MAGCEEAIIQTLLNDGGVTALISTRIYPGVRLQGSALPAAVFNVISATPSYSDDGDDGIEENRVQIDCWGETYSSAKSVARAVIGALSGFGGSVDGVDIKYVSLDMHHDSTEGGTKASEYLHRTSLDFIVTFSN
jgi:hypothetical protein